MKYLSILLLLIMVVILSGCFSFGQSMDKAREVYESSKEQMDTARSAWEQSTKDLSGATEIYNDWQNQMDKARDNEEWDNVQRLKAQVDISRSAFERAKKYEKTTKATYEATAPLAKAAYTDFKDAESADDYVGTAIGWGASILGMLGIPVGGLLALGQRKKKNALAEAASVTANNTQKYIKGDDWDLFLQDQSDKMSVQSRKAFREARKG